MDVLIVNNDAQGLLSEIKNGKFIGADSVWHDAPALARFLCFSGKLILPLLNDMDQLYIFFRRESSVENRDFHEIRKLAILDES